MGKGRTAVGGFLFVRFDDLGDGKQLVAFLEVDEFHALGAASRFADPGDARADALALGREQHHLVGVANTQCASNADRTVLGQVNRDDARTAATDAAVILKGGALADAILARDEQAGLRIADLERLDVIALLLETHGRDAAGEAALGAQALLRAGGLGLALGGRGAGGLDGIRGLIGALEASAPPGLGEKRE